ncbi:MAG: pilus assembly protein PilM [Candidatus Omnitrophica bacterium]|nr:pilus assembly protein PilM [Candidatus Omnitrophota bacterium]
MPFLPFANAIQPASQLLKRLTTVKTPEAKLTVGLDIGSTSIKALALGARKGSGPRDLLGHQVVPLDAGQEGDVSGAVKTAMSALPLGVRTVNLSVSGQWVIIRIVEMPAMKPAEMKQALPFEAQRYLPFNIQDVVIDGATLGPADANKAWVLIVACKKELLQRRIDWVKGAGLEVAVIDVDALAVANAFLAGRNGRRLEGTRALINVGAQVTNLVVFQGESPYLVRDIPWGGDKLIRSTAEQVGLEAVAVGEQLKQGTPNPEILNAMKLASEALVTELQLSFDYFENRFGQPPDEVLVSGGLGQSAGFLDILKGHVTQAVSPWVPMNGLSAQFAVAYGLALRTD